jgi:hypothetical protein
VEISQNFVAFSEYMNFTLSKAQSEARQHHYPLNNLRYKKLALYIMAVRVVEFSNGGYKIRKVFA